MYLTLGLVLAATAQVNGQLEVFHSCFNGSSLEGKFIEAFGACNVKDMDHWEFNILHSEAAEACNVLALDKAFREQAQDGVCLMSVLGWLNEDQTMNHDAVKADMATLPKEIINTVQQMPLQECVKAHHAELDDLLADSNCEFNDTIKESLQALNEKIADYKCTLQAFGRACVMYSGVDFNSLESSDENSEEDSDEEFDPEDVSDDFSPESIESFESIESPESIESESNESGGKLRGPYRRLVKRSAELPEDFDPEDVSDDFSPESIESNESEESESESGSDGIPSEEFDPEDVSDDFSPESIESAESNENNSD